MKIHNLLILLKQEYTQKLSAGYYPEGIGICIAAGSLYLNSPITKSDYDTLKLYLKTNRPRTWKTVFGFTYWWNPSNTQSRIKWLDKHIKKTKFSKNNLKNIK